MAAIEPFIANARSEGRALVASGQKDGRYSLPNYYYKQSAGNAAFDAKHKPRVERWREASATFLIVSPEGAKDHVAFFDHVITKEIAEGRFMSQSELVTWLKQLENKSHELTKGCRSLL